jgi:hypothetical protein
MSPSRPIFLEMDAERCGIVSYQSSVQSSLGEERAWLTGASAELGLVVAFGVEGQIGTRLPDSQNPLGCAGNSSGDNTNTPPQALSQVNITSTQSCAHISNSNLDL